jgi:hypothetical protein
VQREAQQLVQPDPLRQAPQARPEAHGASSQSGLTALASAGRLTRTLGLMTHPASFVVASQSWLKAAISVATLGFGALGLYVAIVSFGRSELNAWIIGFAIAGGTAWLVSVGVSHMRFFGVTLRVEEDSIRVASKRFERQYPIAELTLRTRPVANAIEIRHRSEGVLFVADMYSRNVPALMQTFERAVANEA